VAAFLSWFFATPAKVDGPWVGTKTAYRMKVLVAAPECTSLRTDVRSLSHPPSAVEFGMTSICGCGG
jgi:hypothetical protein